MLAILKDYDEDIMSINYDNPEENGRRRGVYKILSKSHKKALPLNVYGDGMKKQLGNLSNFVELNSQLFDYISTEDYFQTITAPKKEMQLIDSWGHTVPQESPKEFADTLMQVLETITN